MNELVLETTTVIHPDVIKLSRSKVKAKHRNKLLRSLYKVQSDCFNVLIVNREEEMSNHSVRMRTTMVITY